MSGQRSHFERFMHPSSRYVSVSTPASDDPVLLEHLRQQNANLASVEAAPEIPFDAGSAAGSVFNGGVGGRTKEELAEVDEEEGTLDMNNDQVMTALDSSKNFPNLNITENQWKVCESKGFTELAQFEHFMTSYIGDESSTQVGTLAGQSVVTPMQTQPTQSELSVHAENPQDPTLSELEANLNDLRLSSSDDDTSVLSIEGTETPILTAHEVRSEAGSNGTPKTSGRKTDPIVICPRQATQTTPFRPAHVIRERVSNSERRANASSFRAPVLNAVQKLEKAINSAAAKQGMTLTDQSVAKWVLNELGLPSVDPLAIVGKPLMGLNLVSKEQAIKSIGNHQGKEALLEHMNMLYSNAEFAPYSEVMDVFATVRNTNLSKEIESIHAEIKALNVSLAQSVTSMNSTITSVMSVKRKSDENSPAAVEILNRLTGLEQQMLVTMLPKMTFYVREKPMKLPPAFVAALLKAPGSQLVTAMGSAGEDDEIILRRLVELAKRYM